MGGGTYKIFMEISGQCYMVSAFSLVSLTDLCSSWYGLRDLFTLHKLVHGQSYS